MLCCGVLWCVAFCCVPLLRVSIALNCVDLCSGVLRPVVLCSVLIYCVPLLPVSVALCCVDGCRAVLC